MDRKTARRVIKASVWQNMQGNWLKAFLVMIIHMFIITTVLGFSPVRIPSPEEIYAATETGVSLIVLLFPKGITLRIIASIAVTAALYILVSCPLSVGIYRFFLSIARGEEAKVLSVFSPFASLKTVFSSIWLQILIVLVSVFWGVLFLLIPIALMFIATYFGSYIIADVAIVVTYAMMIFAILWISRYTFALYIFAEGELGPFKSLRECIKLMSYRSGECMTLRASYFGWDILTALVIPLTFVYQPLFCTVYAKYLHYLRGELSINESEFPPEM